MPFEKGKLRTGGREKGVPNKITADLRAMLNDFLTVEWELIMQDFKQLELKERLIYYEKLLQYCLPKNNKSSLDSEEVKVEQPIFETVHCYELDLEKIKYPELRQMLEDSEVYRNTKQGALIRIELPDNHRKYESE